MVLKKDAQVLLVKNLDQDKGLVNGSRGTIIDWQLAPDDRADDWRGISADLLFV